MTEPVTQSARGPVVEEEVQLTLVDLCQACRVPEEYVIAWVIEGVLEPVGEAPKDWRFTGPALRRARLALWLTRNAAQPVAALAKN